MLVLFKAVIFITGMLKLSICLSSSCSVVIGPTFTREPYDLTIHYWMEINHFVSFESTWVIWIVSACDETTSLNLFLFKTMNEPKNWIHTKNKSYLRQLVSFGRPAKWKTFLKIVTIQQKNINLLKWLKHCWTVILSSESLFATFTSRAHVSEFK